MIESGPSLNIYFMTGTGNSYWAAKTLAGLAEETCRSVNIFSTDKRNKEDLKPEDRKDIVAFSYPTHGFSLPWHMLKFILRFPVGKGRIILINSRAGMKAGKLFTPGISGIAMLLPMLILLLKGYKIHGVLPMDTPSNWISIHPGLRKKVIDSIFAYREREISKLWAKIHDKKKHYPLKFFVLLPVDILVIPISFGYIFFGRFMLARTYLADKSCDACGICADRCPVGAIKMVNNRPWWTYRCESCMRCANVCPKKSINSSIPLMALYMVILGWIGDTEIFRRVLSEFNDLAGFAPSKLNYYILFWVITIVATWLLYIAIFYLNRLIPFNHLFAFTTPMRYWRRYIAPGFRGKYK